jgi:hypothetical protein
MRSKINSSLDEKKRGNNDAVPFASATGIKTPSSFNQHHLHDPAKDMHATPDNPP